MHRQQPAMHGAPQILTGVSLALQFKTVAPVGDRVFVKVDVSEEKTTSGILLPSSAQKKPTQGEIVTAGGAKAVKVRGWSSRGVWQSVAPPAQGNVTPNGWVERERQHGRPAVACCYVCPTVCLPCLYLQAGDKVVYSKYAGTEIKLQDTDYVLLKASRESGAAVAAEGSCEFLVAQSLAGFGAE